MFTGRRFGGSVVMSLAAEQDAPGARGLEAGDAAQERGLAAAGRAEEREELALGDRDRHVVEGPDDLRRPARTA